MRRRSATPAGSSSRASSRKLCNSDMIAFRCVGPAGSKKQLTAERAILRPPRLDLCQLAGLVVRRQLRSKRARGEPMSDEKPFSLEEATIDELHEAIRAGRTTCVSVVQHYLDRVRAYNDVASLLVTENGAPILEAVGTVRGMAPLRFPTETVAASKIFPDLDEYKGLPLEFGRMEPTASDPSVQQPYGMITGQPNAGQLNALATLNIRGERSVTCRGEF